MTFGFLRGVVSSPWYKSNISNSYEQIPNKDQSETPLEAKKPSPAIPREIDLPLTPIDGVELSTTLQQQPWHGSLIDLGSDLDDQYGNSNAIYYDSDSSVIMKSTIEFTKLTMILKCCKLNILLLWVMMT